MKSTNIRQQIVRINQELTSWQKKQATFKKREADKTAAIGRSQRQLSGATTQSSIAARMREIQRLSKDVESALSKQSDVQGKIAQLTGKKLKLENELHKALEKEQIPPRTNRPSPMSDRRITVMQGLSAQKALKHYEETRQREVFICHASEDKEAFVRPLADALRQAGVDVWFDEFELLTGDSLRRSIDKGLQSAKFGVVVLSSAFFSKEWAQRELDGLTTIEVDRGVKVILPIWYEVTKMDVSKYSPSLADKLAIVANGSELSEIVSQIQQVLKRDG